MTARRILIICIAALAALALAVPLRENAATERRVFSLPISHAASLVEKRGPDQVVAPGFVEPVTKELKLGFDLSGVIAEVLVKEGDAVGKGQVLARLHLGEYAARLEEVKAAERRAQADWEMHQAGSRQAERDRAVAELDRTTVRLEQAKKETERRIPMARARSIGEEELERARRDQLVAEAEYIAAKQTLSLVNEKYRKEEMDMAKARLAEAKAAVAEAEAVLEKSELRAPVAGTVLRIYSDPGVAYSIFTPSPVLSMGDISVLNVRAEVDERDVGRVMAGQKAFVAAAAFAGRAFPGVVLRLERSMTPKKNRSGDPSEPVDRSVLEALVRLDEPGPLLCGLRVDVYIETAPGADGSALRERVGNEPETRNTPGS